MSKPLPFDERFRCTATSRRTGERCRSRAIAGATVCHHHGGATPQVKRAAARRLLRERLNGEVGGFLDDLTELAEDVDPAVTLSRCIARAESLATVWEAKVGALSLDDGVPGRSAGGLVGVDHLDDQAVAVAAVELRKTLELAGRLAKLGVDSGLAERLVTLREQEAELLRELVEDGLAFARIAVLNALGASGVSRDLRDTVGQILDVEAKKRVATSIRASVAGEDRPPLPALEPAKPEPARPEPQSPARLRVIDDDDQEDDDR